MSQVLDALYDELEEVFYSKRGYIIPAREAALVEATGGSPTYGEITGEGVQQFLAAVPLQRDDVLVDLGSGLGRLTLQVAASARLARCVGIELSASRHEQARWVAERLGELAREAAGAADDGFGGREEEEEERAAEPQLVAAVAATNAGRGSSSTSDGSGSSTSTSDRSSPSFSLGLPAQQRSTRLEAAAAAAAAGPPSPQHHQEEEGQQQLLLSPVELRCEDLLSADLRDGTAFFLCSTAFSAAACRSVAERLAAHPPFRLLVTSRALPFPSPLMQLGQFRCSFSWTAAGTAYVYVRSLQDAPAPLLAAFLSLAGPAAGAEAASQRGGIAWLPSLSTMAVVPGDLMV